MIPFRIDSKLLDELTASAKVNERKRIHYDLRDSEDEESMRMLNAIEPDSVIPIHRHTMTSEDVVVIRGCVEEVLYDDCGKEVDRVRLRAGSDCVACHVPRGQYHTCVSLESGSVIIEFKTTKYDKEKSEVVITMRD